MSPFQALYGRLPPPIEPYTGRLENSPDLHSWFQDRDSILKLLKTNLEHSKQRMQVQANRHRRDVTYQIGDQVLLKLQPYRQASIRPVSYSKFSKRYYGPFKILDKFGSVAYKLDLPAYSRIHPVFHVSLLKPFKSDTDNLHTPLPPDNYFNHPILQPQSKLATRTVLHDGSPCTQHLIQWQTLPPSAATWLDESELQRVFPHFDLADKVSLPGPEANVTANRGEPAEPESDAEPETHARPIRARNTPAWLKDYETQRG